MEPAGDATAAGDAVVDAASASLHALRDAHAALSQREKQMQELVSNSAGLMEQQKQTHLAPTSF